MRYYNQAMKSLSLNTPCFARVSAMELFSLRVWTNEISGKPAFRLSIKHNSLCNFHGSVSAELLIQAIAFEESDSIVILTWWKAGLRYSNCSACTERT